MRIKRILCFFVFLFFIFGCRFGQSINSNITPAPSTTTAPISTTPVSISTATLVVTATIPIQTFEPTIASTPEIASPIVSMTYPNYQNCTIQVDTHKWKIDNLWKENIIGQYNNATNGIVLISNKFLVYLAEHQMYPGCQVAWSPRVGFSDESPEVSFETINDKNWEIWNVSDSIRIYFWTELRDISFMQVSPADLSKQKNCTEDVYQIIESLSCK